MDKVYLAELDVRTAKLVSKIDQATKLTLDASNKMTMAFNKVNTSMEKDLKSSSIALNKFSKRDLGMLANQMLSSAGSTGKLTGQLSNLATGLLTGGFIGGAFAGFAAILNLTTEKAGKLKEVMGEIIKINKSSGAFNVVPEKIPEAIALLKGELSALEDPSVMLPGFQGKIWGSGARDALRAAISELEAYQKENSEKQKIIGTLQKAGLAYTEEALNKQTKITKEVQKQLEVKNQEYEIWKSITRPKSPGLVGLGKDQETQRQLEYDIWKSMTRPKGSSLFEPAKNLEEAQNPMNALVSLSNQMASNFSFAGHTFVGQLSQAIAMVDSISNMILTVATIFGGGGGFGLGGLLGLIGLEKGGRVSNKFGSLTHTSIPSFARGGSYSTPGYAGPMAGGYPVMVHKNETLDVYNSGQTSRMEKIMMSIKDAMIVNNLYASKRSSRGSGNPRPIIISLDGKKIAKVVQSELNTMNREQRNLSEF